MPRINRRALLLHSGSAVVASSMTATALGAEPPSRDQELSNSLRALIEAHKTAYAEFGKALHEIDGGSGDSARASREEERALEACGELDLAEHMQALLHSTMWRA
ncbi:hypothetical protein ACFSQT_35785 [Mesorhizobium calcicola]|uniref:Twin-arginine translocation pathway signal n=1 Tax=Mesorhizobium calcicola TaxID=1300310 RepID=A0ABW4WP56_9HYPH